MPMSAYEVTVAAGSDDDLRRHVRHVARDRRLDVKSSAREDTENCRRVLWAEWRRRGLPVADWHEQHRLGMAEIRIPDPNKRA